MRGRGWEQDERSLGVDMRGRGWEQDERGVLSCPLPNSSVSHLSLLTMSTPKDHQSAVVPCPFLLTTSGAMYSTVPQKEKVF